MANGEILANLRDRLFGRAETGATPEGQDSLEALAHNQGPYLEDAEHGHAVVGALYEYLRKIKDELGDQWHVSYEDGKLRQETLSLITLGHSLDTNTITQFIPASLPVGSPDYVDRPTFRITATPVFAEKQPKTLPPSLTIEVYELRELRGDNRLRVEAAADGFLTPTEALRIAKQAIDYIQSAFEKSVVGVTADEMGLFIALQAHLEDVSGERK